MNPEEIRARIRAALPDAEVSVNDTTGGGDHFAATVVSSAFAGKGPVMAAIHALALTTRTPQEQSK